MRGLELFVNKPKILMWIKRRILAPADESESPETPLSSISTAASPAADESVSITAKSYFSLLSRIST